MSASPSTLRPLLGAEAQARPSRPVTLDAGGPASAAFVEIAAECTDHFRTNAELLLGSRAMPHLHQTRVGIRRLRSAFSLFRPLLRDVPAALSVVHRLRALALPFGPARDLDVLLAGPLADDLDPDQLARLSADREAAYDVALAVLRSEPWADAVHQVRGIALLAPWPGVTDPPVLELEARALEKRWRRVVGPLDQLAAMSPAERHLVRIEAKKLRYGCEFFASLHPATPQVVTASGESLSRPLAFGRQAEQVQTALGLVNDHATAEDLLVGVGSHAPSVDEHRLVDEAVEAVRTLAALDPFWR